MIKWTSCDQNISLIKAHVWDALHFPSNLCFSPNPTQETLLHLVIVSLWNSLGIWLPLGFVVLGDLPDLEEQCSEVLKTRLPPAGLQLWIIWRKTAEITAVLTSGSYCQQNFPRMLLTWVSWLGYCPFTVSYCNLSFICYLCCVFRGSFCVWLLWGGSFGLHFSEGRLSQVFGLICTGYVPITFNVLFILI